MMIVWQVVNIVSEYLAYLVSSEYEDYLTHLKK